MRDKSGPPDAASGRGLSFMAAAACRALVGLDLRPPLVSMGPLLVSVRAQFGLAHAAAALLIAIPDLLMGLLAVLAPGLARRHGRDRVILAALALLAAATVGRAFAGSTTALFLATTGVRIAIAGALAGGCFVKAAFPRRAAPLMAVYTAALSLGSTLAAGITAPVAASTHGWRLGTGLWAIPGLTAIAAWVVERRHGGMAAPSRRHRLPVRSRKAWFVALFFAAQNFLFYALISWLAPLYREGNLDGTAAGLVLASFTGSFFVANTLSGVNSRRPDRRPLLAGHAALAFLGLVLLAAAPMAAPFAVAPVIAFGLGGCFTLGITLPLDNTGDADEANAWGGAFMNLIAYLVASTGPIAVGALRDATHGFGGALWLLAAAGAAMLGLTPFLGPDRGGCG